jgi:hypothetical protein
MTKGAEMLKRASRFAVSSGQRTDSGELTRSAGKTTIVGKELYQDALRKAGKKVWATTKAAKKKT